jgi:hypothetical protein
MFFEAEVISKGTKEEAAEAKLQKTVPNLDFMAPKFA